LPTERERTRRIDVPPGDENKRKIEGKKMVYYIKRGVAGEIGGECSKTQKKMRKEGGAEQK